jgi:hypothetical protein
MSRKGRQTLPKSECAQKHDVEDIHSTMSGTRVLLSSLVRRLDRAQEAGRGLNLTPEDIDALVATGAYRTLADAAIRQKEDQCRARNVPTQFISEGTSNFFPPVRIGGTLKSSGMIPAEDANGALQRALTACGRAD